MVNFADAVKNDCMPEFIDWVEREFAVKLVNGSKDRDGQIKAGKNKVTSSQIRRIHSTVKKMELGGFNESDFALLKAQMFYTAKRHSSKAMDSFKTEFVAAVEAVTENTIDDATKRERFNRFCKCFEAVLAYHYAYGGK